MPASTCCASCCDGCMTVEPTAGTLRSSDGAFTGIGGLRLAFRTWETPWPRAAIVLVHGLGDHSGRYEAFGRAMAGFGMSTFAADLRGHGRSEGRRGHVPSFHTFLLELDRFQRDVAGMVPFRLPTFVVGVSLGGLIALRYLEEYDSRFRGAVICSPWLATAMPVPRWKVMFAGAFDRFLPALPFRSGLDPDDFTRDADVVEAYRADPLVHGSITPRLFAQSSAAMGLVLQRSDRIRAPLLFMLGGDDRVVSTERTLRFARSMSGGDVSIRVLPEHRHELLQEVDRAATFRRIRDWITAHLE
jgi:alpha-beta hydrolase superfamily lysophospholipase